MFGNIRFCNHLNDVGIGSLLIQTNAIVGRHHKPNSIAASHLITGVIGATLTQNKVTAWHIGTDALNSRHYGSAGISGNHIAPIAVVNSHIATDAVNGRALAPDSVNTSHINTNAVNGVALAPLAVSSGHVGTQTLTLGGATHGVALGKLNALVMSVPFATQGVTVGVTHGLGRAAYGWFVVGQNKRADIHAKANVATQLRLQATGVACTDIAVKVVVW